MYHAVTEISKKLLAQGLDDDSWHWDWTTLGTLGNERGKIIGAKVVAKSEGVWAADPIVEATVRLSHELGLPVRIESRVKSGQKLKPGQEVCAWSGPAGMVLALERPFLNLASYVCGVATATRTLVDVAEKVSKDRPRITSTRKTLPGYRDLAVHGVIAGGGHSHRVSLSGGVLIKENHIAAAGGIARAIAGARSVAPHGLKVEIEVRSIGELQQAIDGKADGVLLDNFTPAQVDEAVALIGKTAPTLFVEVSGGVNESNIGSYVRPGVHVISSGSLTHTVKAVDLSLLVDGLAALA